MVGSIFLSEKVVEQPGIVGSVYSRCAKAARNRDLGMGLRVAAKELQEALKCD